MPSSMNDDRMIALPLNATWLTAAGVGRMLGGRDGRQVRERIACTPQFPKPLRINGSAHPLWRADDEDAQAQAGLADVLRRKELFDLALKQMAATRADRHASADRLARTRGEMELKLAEARVQAKITIAKSAN